MKTNKLAAGALALALGLGAITPAFAEETQVPEDKINITDNGEVSIDQNTTPSKDEVIANAQKALDDAKIVKQAVELLFDLTPETVKNIRADLEKLLEEQEILMEKLNSSLEDIKKVAISNFLFSTAYAEGEEDEKLRKIIEATNALNENTNKIKALLKENEANLKSENDNAGNPTPDEPETPGKPETPDEPSGDEKKGSLTVKHEDGTQTVITADDEKAKATIEKDPKKVESMVKDGKEDKKDKEDKEETTTVKKSSTNAKTGVLGIAGVAGVLAAAAVAYAASKKNN